MTNPQGFPFGTAAPFRSGDPFLGGQIIIVPAGAASANAIIKHNLRRLPRAFLVLDVGAQTALATPFARGTTAWTQAAFSLVLPGLTAAVTGVLV